MTKREISALLGYKFTKINKMFREAEKTNPKLAEKNGKSTKARTIDYKLDEVMAALVYLTPMERQYLKEHFIHREGLYAYRSENQKLPWQIRNFIFMYTHSYSLRCCNTCAYLIPKKMNQVGSKIHPFCDFYGCFLNKTKQKLDVYTDSCESFLKGENIPVLWFEKNPVKLDVYLEKKAQILGRDPNEYTSERTSVGEPINLLKEEEWDIYDD